MDARIRGSFPGGPSRHRVAGPPTRKPRLSTVADIEERLAGRRRSFRTERRRRRIAFGLAAVAVAAFGAGITLGRMSHATREELMAAQRQHQMPSGQIDAEVSRVLMELWKMEDVEALRNRGKIR